MKQLTSILLAVFFSHSISNVANAQEYKCLGGPNKDGRCEASVYPVNSDTDMACKHLDAKSLDLYMARLRRIISLNQTVISGYERALWDLSSSTNNKPIEDKLLAIQYEISESVADTATLTESLVKLRKVKQTEEVKQKISKLLKRIKDKNRELLSLVSQREDLQKLNASYFDTKNEYIYYVKKYESENEETRSSLVAAETVSKDPAICDVVHILPVNKSVAPVTKTSAN